LRTGDPAAARQARLQHIAEAIARIREDTGGGKKAFLASRVHQQAVILNLLIIGEAVKHIDRESLSTQSGIPWTDITGMRDVIAHKYYHLDLDLVWDIITKNLAPLAAAVAALRRRG